MSALTALLRECAENPEDDAPRMVLADWLEDHGDTARAEFVRVQVELSRLSAYDPRRPELEGRERALQTRDNLESWLGRLMRLEITIDREGAVALAESSHIAGLRELVVSGSMGDAGMEALASSPHLAGLWCLDLRT